MQITRRECEPKPHEHEQQIHAPPHYAGLLSVSLLFSLGRRWVSGGRIAGSCSVVERERTLRDRTRGRVAYEEPLGHDLAGARWERDQAGGSWASPGCLRGCVGRVLRGVVELSGFVSFRLSDKGAQSRGLPQSRTSRSIAKRANDPGVLWRRWNLLMVSGRGRGEGMGEPEDRGGGGREEDAG